MYYIDMPFSESLHKSLAAVADADKPARASEYPSAYDLIEQPRKRAFPPARQLNEIHSMFYMYPFSSCAFSENTS